LLSSLAETDLESAWLFSHALMRGGDSQRAAQVLDRVLKGENAASPKLLIARGIVAKAQGALPEASGFFEKALAAHPEHGRALVELAEVKLLQNDTQQAAQLLDKALAQDARKTLDGSEEARGAMLRGKLLVAQHHGKEAEAAFERAVQLDPNSAEVHAAYGAFRLHRREYDKAQKQLDAALAIDPGNARVLAEAARAYVGTNRLLEADKRIQDAVARAANDPWVLYAQGRVAEGIGKQEDAYKAYDKAVQKKPDLAEALIAQGAIWFSRGEKQKAREKLEAVLKTSSRSARQVAQGGEPSWRPRCGRWIPTRCSTTSMARSCAGSGIRKGRSRHCSGRCSSIPRTTASAPAWAPSWSSAASTRKRRRSFARRVSATIATARPGSTWRARWRGRGSSAKPWTPCGGPSSWSPATPSTSISRG
jgi:tetratricopeptide (TPR) repeat protein